MIVTRYRDWRGRYAQENVPEEKDLNLKWCPTHRSFLKRSEFYRNTHKPDGLYSRCKKCHNKYTNEYKRRKRRERGLGRLGGKTHGKSHTPEYASWSAAKSRCHNSTNQTYSNYGARGISMCLEWRGDFMAFYEHIGPRPSSKHSLDRIENNGNYEPGNVRWATRSMQTINQKRYSEEPDQEWFSRKLRKFREINTGPAL